MGTLGLTSVHARIDAACRRADRDPGEVRLVAVTKAASDDEVLAAYEGGHRDFGENRAGELAERASRMPADIRWHFIGQLQGNKVRRVRPVTTLLHSLDRPELVGYWVKGPGLPPPALVQVNVAGEAQKGGVDPADAEELVEEAIGAGIPVEGLMTMAPLVEDPEEARPVFRALAALRDDVMRRHPTVRHLSMGMTDDFEVAVEEGATILRVGRAIFGAFPEG
jgi:pyridoxal phosphate enzyme (YggS family)